MENCDIFENECAGIEVKGGANPTILKNRIFNGMEARAWGEGRGPLILCAASIGVQTDGASFRVY